MQEKKYDREIKIQFNTDWENKHKKGLLVNDQKTKTVIKVIISYPEIRHIVPSAIRFDSNVSEKTIETIANFLERQKWMIEKALIH